MNIKTYLAFAFCAIIFCSYKIFCISPDVRTALIAQFEQAKTESDAVTMQTVIDRLRAADASAADKALADQYEQERALLCCDNPEACQLEEV